MTSWLTSFREFGSSLETLSAAPRYATQTRVVRCYGLYHQTHTEALALCRAHLGQPPMAIPEPLVWQTLCAQRGDVHPERCPTCGQLLVCTGVIPRGGAPPRLASEECAA